MRKMIPMLLLASGLLVAIGTVASGRPDPEEIEPVEIDASGTLHWELESAIIPTRALKSPLGFSQPQIVETSDRELTAFRNVVTTQPTDYPSDNLHRGVVSLGDEQFGFVLIAAPTSSDASKRFDMLLVFDADGDGDLTNETAVQGVRGERASTMAFPPIVVQTSVDGSPCEYAVHAESTIMIQSPPGMMGSPMITGMGLSMPAPMATPQTQPRGNLKQEVMMSFRAGAFRQGTIRVDGQSLSVALLDANSNGRFDDMMPDRARNVAVAIDGADRIIFRTGGSAIAADPPGTHPGIALSNLILVGGNAYTAQVASDGSSLTLEPFETELGSILANDNGGRSGTILSGVISHPDYGTVEMKGCVSSRAIALPEGEWSFLGGTLSAGLSTTATLTADAKTDDFTVTAGETTVLPYGDTFRGRVRSSNNPLTPGESTSFSVDIYDGGGARCQDFVINGERPRAPELLIQTEEGERVHVDRFSYG